MNYRHTYHAGNFADAFKHIILIALIESLQHKDHGFCFLDTHAGIGCYDLFSSMAQKSREFDTGISKILAQPNPPALIQKYLACVQAVNHSATKKLQYYPGSPAIAHQLLRPQDRMILTELHAEDFRLLRRTFPHDKQVAVHHQDGYHALKAFLPPPERRGLVLIDPPYEQADEITTVLSALATAIQRWETGVYALWYPIKEYRALERFHRAAKQKIARPALLVELSIYPEDLATHLNGSGLLIVNPPWQLDSALNAVLPWLWETLRVDDHGRYDIKTL
jgi:23S rRNA (adenine2030-N6)-methyltransferase